MAEGDIVGSWGEESHARGLFKPCHDCYISRRGVVPRFPFSDGFDAGWSSPVARQAHNLKVVGSNPTPATITPLDSGAVPATVPAEA